MNNRDLEEQGDYETVEKPETIRFPDSGVDVVGSLRRLADQIEAGDFGEVRYLVFGLVDRTDRLAAFVWGKVSCREAVGAFCQAAHMTAHTLEEYARDVGDDKNGAA